MTDTPTPRRCYSAEQLDELADQMGNLPHALAWDMLKQAASQARVLARLQSHYGDPVLAKRTTAYATVAETITRIVSEESGRREDRT